MSEAKVDLTVQSSQAEQAWQRYAAKILQATQAQQKLTAEQKQALQEEKQLSQVRDKLLRNLQETETAQQRHARQLDQLNLLRKKSKVTEEEYAWAVGQSKKQLMESTHQGNAGLDTMITRLAGVAAGYLSIQTGVSWWMNANKDLLDQANQLGDKYDTMQRRFRVQASLDSIQGKEAQRKIVDQAFAGGNTREQAAEASVAMATTGFSNEVITGGGLREVLKFYNAQTVDGSEANFGTMTQAITRYLKSQKLEMSVENIRMLGQKVQGLKETPLKVTDLEFLANEAAEFSGKMSVDDQLAVYGQLMEIKEGDQASTNFRNIVGRLASARVSGEKKRALRKLKLKPEDVDLVGETFDEAIGKIDRGLQQRPEKEREGIIKLLFEERAVPAFIALAKGADERTALKQQMQRDLVNEDAAVFERGPAAANRRQDLNLEQQKVKRDDRGNEWRKAIESELLDRGYSPLSTAYTLKKFDIHRLLGNDPDVATSEAIDGYGAKNREISTNVRRRVMEARDPQGEEEKRKFREAGEDEQRKLREALEANTKATQENTRQNDSPRANTRPTSPRPAAANSLAP
jgi:hypothetical protein